MTRLTLIFKESMRDRCFIGGIAYELLVVSFCMAPKSLMIPFKVVIVITEIFLEKLTLYILFVYQVVPFLKKNQDMYLIFSPFYSPISKIMS